MAQLPGPGATARCIIFPVSAGPFVPRSGLELLDRGYGRSRQSVEVDDGRSSETEQRPQRQSLEIKPRRRDVFAKVAGIYVVAQCAQFTEELTPDHVHLAQVGKAGRLRARYR